MCPPAGVKANVSLRSKPMSLSLDSLSETETIPVFRVFLDRGASLGNSEGGFRQRESLGGQQRTQEEGWGQGGDRQAQGAEVSTPWDQGTRKEAKEVKQRGKASGSHPWGGGGSSTPSADT